MRIKITAILWILLTTFIFSSCSKQNDAKMIVSSTSSNINATFEDGQIPKSESFTIDTALTSSKYIVKLRVESCDLFMSGVYTFKCTVLKDYIGNIDYMGMNDAEIMLSHTSKEYIVGEVYYMFLQSGCSDVFPFVIYGVATEPSLVIHEYTEAGQTIQDLGSNPYHLDQKGNLEDILTEASKKKAEDPSTFIKDKPWAPESLSQAVDNADVILRAIITTKEDWHKYLWKYTYKTTEILKGHNSNTERFLEQEVSNNFPVNHISEGDEVIILLKSEEGTNGHRYLSKDFCLVKAGSDDDQLILSMLSKK